MAQESKERNRTSLTSVRESAEEDAWRISRQKLASKQCKQQRGSSAFHQRSSLEGATLHRHTSPKKWKDAKDGNQVSSERTLMKASPQVGSPSPLSMPANISR